MRDDLNVTELTIVISDEEMIGNHKLFIGNFTDAPGVCIYSGERNGSDSELPILDAWGCN
jgi:hypothetical protein